MYHFLDFASDGVVISDSDGTILSWGGGAQRIFGYKESDVLGKPLSVLMPKKYRARHSRAMAQAPTIRESNSVGRTMLREGLTRGGRRVFVECSTFFWFVGQETFFGAVVRKVAAPDRAQEMWRRSRVDERSLIGRIPGFLMTLDPDGTILFSNRGLMGRSVPDVIGTSAFDYIAVTDHVALRESIEISLKTGETRQCLVSGLDRRGAIRSYQCQIAPIKRGDEFITLVLVAIDATGREEMLEALERKVEREMAQRRRYRLTHRELMVLNLGVEGKSVTEIGTLLGISQLTVRKHLSNILRKMGSHSRADAYVRAVRDGIVE